MKLSTLLQNKAESILANSPEYVAISMLKKAGMSDSQARVEVAQRVMEKEATDHLVATGIDYEAALNLVKVAGVKISDMKEFKIEPTQEEILWGELTKAASLAEELEKKAAQVDELLEKVAELETQLENTVPELPEPITKLASSGKFTQEDLQSLMALPTETLTKVAAAGGEPWSLGGASGRMDVSTMDPILQFCLSD